MKQLLQLIVILLVLSCNNVGNKSSKTKLASVEAITATECMASIIKRDSVMGSIRNHASEQISLSETIDNYVNSLKSLDFNECPEDFKNAFNKHIDAWLAAKKVTDKYPDLRGELHVIFSELKKGKDSVAFKAYEREIFATWESVEKIRKG